MLKLRILVIAIFCFYAISVSGKIRKKRIKRNKNNALGITSG